LIEYANFAKLMKLNYYCILAVSNHFGEVICQQVTNKKISFVFVGRRGLSAFKRILLGSTSRFCMEHANCNVVVVKGEWGPEEIHDSKTAVLQQEEKERQRRIKEEEDFEKLEKFHSALDLNIVRLAEETERMSRIKEEQDAKLKEKKDREADKIGAVIDEENERKRRIEEESIIDKREHKLEIFEYNFTQCD